MRERFLQGLLAVGGAAGGVGAGLESGGGKRSQRHPPAPFATGEKKKDKKSPERKLESATVSA